MEKSLTKYATVPLRVIQLISIASIVTGFIWGTSDYLLVTVLVASPVTPISVLLMLYGTLGTILSEAVVRFLLQRESA